MTTSTNAGGRPGVCPGCGASWTVLGGMLPLPLRCSCSGAFEWHDAWRCEHCRIVLAQGCQDTGSWAHEYARGGEGGGGGGGGGGGRPPGPKGRGSGFSVRRG